MQDVMKLDEKYRNLIKEYERKRLERKERGISNQDISEEITDQKLFELFGIAGETDADKKLQELVLRNIQTATVSHRVNEKVRETFSLSTMKIITAYNTVEAKKMAESLYAQEQKEKGIDPEQAIQIDPERVSQLAAKANNIVKGIVDEYLGKDYIPMLKKLQEEIEQKKGKGKAPEAKQESDPKSLPPQEIVFVKKSSITR